MKLCEEQKIWLIFTLQAIWVILSVFFFVIRVIPTISILISLIALSLACSVPSLIYLFTKNSRAKKKLQRKLNNEVFKKWKEVIINRDRFQIEYIFKTPIDTDSYERGKRFLTSSKDTQDILVIWNTLNDLKAKYDDVGNRIKEPVTKTFAGNYPSLKELQEFSDAFTGDCFAISNILKLLDENSMKLVNDAIIDWTKLVHGEKYIDTTIPIFRLVNQGVLIQSKNQNDVDIKSFQKVIEALKPEITSDIRQLISLYDKITTNMMEFKRRINQVSYDIDL